MMKPLAVAALLVALFSVMVFPGSSAQDVKFYFFSKDMASGGNASYRYRLLNSDLNADELSGAGFNKSQDTKIVIHGFDNNVESESIRTLTDAYHQLRRYNLIAVDWSALSSVLHYLANKRLTHQVAERVATLIGFLVLEGLAEKGKLHIIGHSLGAHMAGVAGKIARRILGRITGLDPARPFIDMKDEDSRLALGDAKLVDVYHTSDNFLGVEGCSGNIDFYPNGGKRQPGCSVWDLVGSCSHGRSYKLFAQTILHALAFVARRCNSKSDVKSGTCEEKETAVAGEFIEFSKPGLYYFKTGDKPPYSLRSGV